MPPPSNTPVRRWVIVILIALPTHTVDFPEVAVTVCAGDLPIVALVVRGQHKRGSLPVIALAACGHRERGDLPVLPHAAPTNRPTLTLPCAPSIHPSLHSPHALATLSHHQLPVAFLLSLPAAESFFG